MTTAPTPQPEALRLAAWLNEGAWRQMRLGDVEAAGRELKRLHAENERLRGDYALRGAQIQRMAALIDELEARKPLPLSDDDRLRLRSDVARAIWDVMREHEDRCDHALEDVEPKHQVWDCADAAIKAVHGITGGSA